MLNLVALVSLIPADAATLVGGDYLGADLVTADGDVLEGVFTNVGDFHVPAGTLVRVQNGVPLVIEATAVLIEGALSADAAGRGGGTGLHHDGFGRGGGRAPLDGGSLAGAGGGGHGGAGGGGGPSGDASDHPLGWAGGEVYGTPDDPLSAPMGSGGAYNNEKGGDGGGSIILRAETIEVAPTGMVSAAGEPGKDLRFDYKCGCGGGGGPGGGSGGSIVFDATVSVVIDGILRATGGTGGEGDHYIYVGGGGGGGGGRIKVYGPMTGTILPTAARGGGGGLVWGDEKIGAGNHGIPGTIYVDAWVAGPPTATVTGVCDSMTFTVSGGTPLGQVHLLTGQSTGADVLTGGVCAGLATGLSGISRLGFIQLDDSGSYSATGPGSSHDRHEGPSCGALLEVVDLWSCTTSGVVALP